MADPLQEGSFTKAIKQRGDYTQVATSFSHDRGGKQCFGTENFKTLDKTNIH